MAIEKIIAGVFGITTCAGLFIGLNYAFNLNTTKTEFNFLYQEKLSLYADINKDGFISQNEKDDFNKLVFSNYNLNLVSGQLPTYKDGKKVSYDKLLYILKNHDYEK
jgi:hypothetical protein